MVKPGYSGRDCFETEIAKVEVMKYPDVNVDLILQMSVTFQGEIVTMQCENCELNSVTSSMGVTYLGPPQNLDNAVGNKCTGWSYERNQFSTCPLGEIPSWSGCNGQCEFTSRMVPTKGWSCN